MLEAPINDKTQANNLFEGHGKLLAGISYEKQYEYAYHAIKKEWSVSTLDDAIKTREDKKLAASKARKLAQPMSSIEKQLTDQCGFPMKVAINKNDTGYFRIHFTIVHTCKQYWIS